MILARIREPSHYLKAIDGKGSSIYILPSKLGIA
jgi:hypothetical protein